MLKFSSLFVGDSTALLRRQGVNVKGLMKAAPAKEEPQPYIDVTGNLQVLYVFFLLLIIFSTWDSRFLGGWF